MPATKQVIRVALLLMSAAAFLSVTAWAQDDSSDQSAGAPPAASTPAEINAENPPLSGLDAPSAEPAYGGRSYLMPGIQLTESINSNANGNTGSNTHVAEVQPWSGISRFAKNLEEQPVGFGLHCRWCFLCRAPLRRQSVPTKSTPLRRTTAFCGAPDNWRYETLLITFPKAHSVLVPSAELAVLDRH